MNNSKKLPKYAVGDVVRYNGKIATIDELSDTPPFFLADIYGEGRIWALTSELSDFDGFRIGDTVWTAKRGKGTIVLGGTHDSERPHCVNYDDGKYPKCVYPKLSNLFPTERKMLESQAEKPFGITVLRGFATPYDPIPFYPNPKGEDWLYKYYKNTFATETLYPQLVIAQNGRMTHKSKFGMGEMVRYAGCITAAVDKIHFEDGKFKYDLRTNSCPSEVAEESLTAYNPFCGQIQVAGQATADLVRPKFKVDDDVFYKGSKWRVIGFRIEGYVLYTIRKGAITEFLIEESDLRLWKETELTHCLQRDTDNWYKFHITMYRNLKYLGCICGHETFTAEDSRGNLALYRGIKGDDIS